MENYFNPQLVDQNLVLPTISTRAAQLSKPDSQIRSEAFYSAGVSGNADPIADYFNKLEELQVSGYSPSVEASRNTWVIEQLQEKEKNLQSIIEDPSVSKEDKIAVINNMQNAGDISVSLRDKYLKNLSDARKVNEVSTDSILSINTKIEDLKIQQDHKQFLESLFGESKEPRIKRTSPEEVLDKAAQLDPSLFDNVMENFVDPINKNFLALYRDLLISIPAYVDELYDISVEAIKPLNDLKALVLESAGIKLRDDWKNHPGYKNLTEIRNKVREQNADSIPTNFIHFFEDLVESGTGYTADDLNESIANGTLKTIDEALMWMSMKVNPENPEAVKIPLELSLIFMYPLAKAGGRYSRYAYRYMKDPNAARLANLFESPIVAYEGPLYNTPNVRKASDMGLDIPVDSPYVSTLIANPTMAKELGLAMIQDTTGNLANALNVTPEQLLYNTLVPETIRKAKWGEQWDATPGMRQIIFSQQRAIQDLIGNTNLYGNKERYAHVEHDASVINSVHDGININMDFPASTIFSNGVKIDSSIIFRKTDTEFYKSVQDVLDATETIKQKIEQLDTQNNPGILTIDHIGPKGEVLGSYSVMDLQRAPEFKLGQLDDLLAQRESTLASQTARQELLNNPETLKYEAEIRELPVEQVRDTIRQAFNRDSKVLKELDQNIAELKNYMESGEAPIDPNFRVRWDKTTDYVDAVTDAHGFGKLSWKSEGSYLSPVVNALYGTRTAWNWLAVFGKMPMHLEKWFSMSAIRSNKFMYEQLKLLRRELGVFNNQMKQDLSTLYKSQQGVSDLLTLNQIHTVLNRAELTNMQAVKLQNILAMTRQIENFNYRMANVFEINRYRAAGYNKAIELLDANGNRLHRMVMEDFQLAPETNPARVWNFADEAGMDFAPHAANFVPTNKKFNYIDGKPVQQLIRLSQPIKDGNGHTYDYALLSKRQLLQDIPKNVIPSKTGHMPNIANANFFIRAYPKVHVHNGIRKEAEVPVRDADGFIESGNIIRDMDPHKVSIAMFETEVQARKWARQNIKQTGPDTWNPDLYEFQIQKANELSPRDNIDAQIIRENALAASRNRAEVPLANAMYEDPFVAFVQSSETIGLRTYLQPVLKQMKTQWIDAYYNKGKVNVLENASGKPREQMTIDELASIDNAFPMVESQIKQLGNDVKSYKQALAEWDAIMILEQGRQSNAMARGLARVSDVIGSLADKDSPLLQSLSKIARKIEKNPNQIVAAPLRAVSTLKIIFQSVWRNISLQPIGVFVPALVANPKNFLYTMQDIVGVVSYRVAQARNFAKYRDYLTEGLDHLYAHENILVDTGIPKTKGRLSKQDYALIYRHLEESGVGIISDHILAKGIFSNTPVRLTQSWKSKQIFEQAGSAIVSGYSKIGFEFGEYINRVGMFMAAREAWVKNNPGKNWRSKAALDQITYDGYRLSGSMNPSNTYMFQNVPLLQYIGQFQSFAMKASENIWNGSASPFTGKQRATMAGLNMAVFGVRGGTLYGMGGLILDWLSSFGDEGKQLADKLDEASLFDIVTNTVGDAFFPTYDAEGKKVKSAAEPSLVYSPFGTTPGAVYGEFLKAFGVLTTAIEPENYQFGPTMTTYNQLSDTINLLSAMYKTETLTFGEKTIGTLEALAKLTSGANSILKFIIGLEYQDKISKEGQKAGVDLTKFENAAQLFNISDRKTRKSFEFWRNNKKLEDKMKDMAKWFYQGMVAGKGPEFTLQDLVNGTKAFNSILQGDEYSDYALELFWNEVRAIDARRYRTKEDALIMQALKMYKMNNKKFTQEEILMIRDLADIITRAHPNQRKQIQMIVDALENSTKPME